MAAIAPDLHVAARAGDLARVKSLLAAQADPNGVVRRLVRLLATRSLSPTNSELMCAYVCRTFGYV